VVQFELHHYPGLPSAEHARRAWNFFNLPLDHLSALVNRDLRRRPQRNGQLVSGMSARVVVAGDAPVIARYLPALMPPLNPSGPSSNIRRVLQVSRFSRPGIPETHRSCLSALLLKDRSCPDRTKRSQ